MNWSGPNVIHFGRKSRFGPDQFILVMTISFWSSSAPQNDHQNFSFVKDNYADGKKMARNGRKMDI